MSSPSGCAPISATTARRSSERIREADTVYYPTTFYADLFNADRQEHLSQLPHLQMRPGQDQADRPVRPAGHSASAHPRLLRETPEADHPRSTFDFPFIAKIARGSAMGRGVFLIRDRGEPGGTTAAAAAVAYIQEYLPIDRDMRIVVIGQRIVHAYWRIAPEGDFRSNVSRGRPAICLDPVPDDALELASRTARACGWDDVGIDICRSDGELLRAGGQHEIRPGGLSRSRHRLCPPDGDDD
ncbi:MAG: RimK family alpha-L-glutamate ligase [Desulfobacterales bacterium]|nr:RimK family alpha-L-glutamate ligase [Desulfobacterales bacterium]